MEYCFQKEVRQVHPLASTSIADMLEEFSQFKFVIIFVGYLLMVSLLGIDVVLMSKCRAINGLSKIIFNLHTDVECRFFERR